MEIAVKKLSELKPYEKNPRKNDDAVEYVANSIKQFGFKVPIIIDKKGVIVAGHTRYKAALQLGMEEVPTIIADDLTPAQIKAYRIADNKTGEKASWDNDLLRDELSDLLEDFNMQDFGFGDFELTILTEDFEPEPYDNELVNEYSKDSEKFLQQKRVIITYDDDTEEKVKAVLGVDEIRKVVYNISEIEI